MKILEMPKKLCINCSYAERKIVKIYATIFTDKTLITRYIYINELYKSDKRDKRDMICTRLRENLWVNKYMNLFGTATCKEARTGECGKEALYFEEQHTVEWKENFLTQGFSDLVGGRRPEYSFGEILHVDEELRKQSIKDFVSELKIKIDNGEIDLKYSTPQLIITTVKRKYSKNIIRRFLDLILAA